MRSLGAVVFVPVAVLQLSRGRRSGESVIKLERPGEEKKKRREARTAVKSGGGE